MKLSYRYEVEGKEILVVDQCFSPKETQELAAYLAKVNYGRTEADSPENAHIVTFATEFDMNKIRGVPPFSVIEEAIIKYFPKETLKPYRAYCNLNVYGDLTFPHRDCETDETDVTALLYANDQWERSWAGETIFYNERGDSLYAICPAPGRLVLFRGAIEHRTGVPSREFYGSRLSIAYKFKGRKL